MKKLTRSQSDKVIAGVLGGFAEYINVDPTVVRLGYVLITLFSCFAGILFYIIAWIIIPEKVSHVSIKDSVKEGDLKHSHKHTEPEKEEVKEKEAGVSQEAETKKED
jgi:phage shock protein PspC (stress-responsive transcriptional regulator)